MDEAQDAALTRFTRTVEGVIERQNRVIASLKRRLDRQDAGLGTLAQDQLDLSRRLLATELLLDAALRAMADRDPDRLRLIDDLRRLALDRIPPADLPPIREALEKTLSSLENPSAGGAKS